MAELNREEIGTLAEAIVMVTWQFIVTIIVILGLFVFGAIELSTFFDKSVFYIGVSAAVIPFLLLFGLVDWLVIKGTLSEQVWGWGKVYAHNPADSILGRVPALLKYLTFWNIVHFSIIFGLGISLYGAVSQTFFIGLPPAEFQATETGKIILETEPAAYSETLLIIGLTSLLYGPMTWLLRKWGVSEQNSALMSYGLIIVAIVLFWFGFHSNRYGTDQIAVQSVILFALLGMLLTFLLGSFIPIYIWHVFNNAFQKSTELFSNEGVTAVILTILIAYISIVVISKVVKALSNRSGYDI